MKKLPSAESHALTNTTPPLSLRRTHVNLEHMSHVTLPTGQLKSLFYLLSALGKGITNWPRIGRTHSSPCIPWRCEEVVPTICHKMADYVHLGSPIINHSMYSIPVSHVMRLSANVHIVNIV